MSSADSQSTADHGAQKRRAAARAASLVESGMVVGLGAGTTAAFAAPALVERVHAGELDGITVVPCSEAVGARARALGLKVVSLAEAPLIELTIDGADEVDPDMNLIKGRGGALLHEKMVAQASRREIIVIDASKLSPRVGTRAPLPVEVFPFGWRGEQIFLDEMGWRPELRMQGEHPFVTDEGNFILDCHSGPLVDAQAIATRLEARAGIASHGLFIGLATDVIVGDDAGVRHMRGLPGAA